MPQTITHLLVPALLLALFRDYYIRKKSKKKFSLHYVLIAGIGGVLPDIDVLFFWIMHFFGYRLGDVHRIFTHSLFFALIFLLFSLVFQNSKIKELGKHKLKLSYIFLALSFGILSHIILDAILIGKIVPFYPFSNMVIGLDLVNFLPDPLNSIAIPTLEGIILVIWLIYLRIKHKISDFL